MADSQLSSARYGYHYVVSTSQRYFDTKMKKYLSGLSSPLVVVCYRANEKGEAKVIEYEELKKQAGGSDPSLYPTTSNQQQTATSTT